ncbi:MAG: GNAT family N-acetyltransferase [Clostridia bacterium]|nr:GNAT family N-acetyltransferase [Clostridia bacterium]
MLEIRNMEKTEIDYKIFKSMYDNLSYIDIVHVPPVSRSSHFSTFEEFSKSINTANFLFIVLDCIEIGYIILDAYLSGVCQIREIYIIPAYQHRGYGQQVMAKFIADLKQDYSLKVLKVISATIATDKFYTKCGFRFAYGDTYEFQLN